jgi:5-carboxymethyl-2-hydroxymuconate isomerase
MVIAIGRGGSRIPRSGASSYIAGYGVGLDMTLRDLQATAKKQGLPWAVAKGFDTSAPVSDFLPASSVHNPDSLDISLAVNEVIRQRSNTSRMLFSVPEIVSQVSEVFTLDEGDLIFTGTPEGVGPVSAGDRLHAVLHSVAELTVSIVTGS